jgi:hypothetical protein
MAKGAATEKNLGNLHSTLTTIFTRVLQGYLDKLDKAQEAFNSDEFNSEIMSELEYLSIEPSPAMLSAIAKFLKDNNISYDSEQIDELSELEQRLRNKKANRPDFSNVTSLPLTGTQ